MRKVAVLTSIVLSLSGMHGARAAEVKDSALYKRSSAKSQSKRAVHIRVLDGDWGNARPDEIEVLLNAVAEELLAHFPGRELNPIVVSPSRSGPVVLYQKGPGNEYQVLLAARGNQWAEYVYEFSHELFHILANYEHHAPPRQARHQWFEEMLGESVSLYTLKRFSRMWEHSPPRDEWRGYAPDMRRFTHRALSEPHRTLPKNISFQTWFRENGPVLVKKPYLREKNELVATFFLPLLEQDPDWRALAYLNLEAPQGESSFYEHLASWYHATPEQHRHFVRHAMRVFHFDEPVEDLRLLTYEKPHETQENASDLPAAGAG